MLICKFCSKECKNKNSLANHERLCKLNPDKQISNVAQWRQQNPDLALEASKRGQFKTGRVSYTKGKPGTFRGKTHSEQTKRQMSEVKKNLYSTGWEPTCGRCKKYEYDSPIAGKIKVDGTWELKVAVYLDKIGVVWNRNRLRFTYVKPDGKTSTYQPDFYIETWETYLEVKGYETDLDKAKWSQFKEPLIVWKKKQIKELEDVLQGATGVC